MSFTKKEQKTFEKKVGKCKTLKDVFDFLFECTGLVNWRMAMFNKYENRRLNDFNS